MSAKSGQLQARFYHEVVEVHLARIVRVDLKSEAFVYSIDERALEHARLMDGKSLLVTNAGDLAPSDVIKRYKSLADIERDFRVLKSEIEIGPICHRLPERIGAHASICFMAPILYRVMRSRRKQPANTWLNSAVEPARMVSTKATGRHHGLRDTSAATA